MHATFKNNSFKSHMLEYGDDITLIGVFIMKIHYIKILMFTKNHKLQMKFTCKTQFHENAKLLAVFRL